jgi:hypothetical protein
LTAGMQGEEAAGQPLTLMKKNFILYFFDSHKRKEFVPWREKIKALNL